MANNAELVRRAKTLVDEINRFLTAREQMQTRPNMRGTADQFDAGVRGMTHDYQELATEYAARFGGRALALREAFMAAGIEPKINEFDIEHPTNPIGVRGVMMAFGRMAETLEFRES